MRDYRGFLLGEVIYLGEGLGEGELWFYKHKNYD